MVVFTSLRCDDAESPAAETILEETRVKVSLQNGDRTGGLWRRGPGDPGSGFALVLQ